jgi:Tol biopolymer transport system component
MTYSPQDQTYVNIWLSGAETNRATNPLLSQKYVSPIVLPNRESMILYDAKNGRTNQTVGNNIIPFQAESKLSANLARLTTSPLLNNGETKRPLHLQLASGINDELIALYNAENFGVVNINTGETKEIIFDEARALIPLNAQWSPDSEKLAILATEKNVPAQFTKLFLFEVEVGQLRELSTGFQYVTNLTWAPDSENLLISVETGSNLNPNGVEYKTSDLFLVNVVSQTIQMVPLLPENTYIDFIWKLSWAPDGQKIVLSAFIPGSNHSLYRIIVKK